MKAIKPISYYNTVRHLVKVKAILVVVFLVSVTLQLQAQIGNPHIWMNLDHPPALGIKVDKVSFNTNNSECVLQLLDPVVSDFVENEVSVLDRQNLNSILAEHNLAFSGYIDQSSAAAMGKILGPTAIITIKVLRCQAVPNNNLYRKEKYKAKDGKYYYRTVYISRMEFYLKASVQVTDLTTGKIFAAQTFDYHEQRDNESRTGRPQLPSQFALQEVVNKQFAWDVHKLFFYWTERVKLTYFDDDKCDLKQAYQLLDAGDADAAYQQSIKNVETCKKNDEKDKFMAHAYYNLGMSYFINSEYDKAIEVLQQSQTYKDNAAVKNAIAACQKAKQLSLAATQFEDRVQVEAENQENTQREAESNTLTNDDVIALTQTGLSETLIIKKIETSTCNFDVSTDALIALTKAGVSDNIIAAMMDK